MKRILSSIVKFLIYFLLLALLIGLVIGLVLVAEWPIWVGVFILVGLVGGILAFIIARKIYKRKRPQLFVDEIVAQDSAFIGEQEDTDKEKLQELQDRWKNAMDTLRRSHLKREGNPLYVLPWYMLIGESGSGKTTAIQSARLSSPFKEVIKTSGISGTRNCDWWFFEEAIIIDTAGRYAIPVDPGPDMEEWKRFLALLLKFRKREPLNGLVVVTAADKLLQASPETMEEEGKEIRLRIDELMKGLGAKFPVYVLVTKCDLVQGMTSFCSQFPEHRLDQAMGYLNEDLSHDVESFQDQAMKAIDDRLREIRLLLFNKPDIKEGIDPAILLFPDEFNNLRKGLNAFIKGAFKENPFQEDPILRGIYFSSGRQEGSPFSSFLSSMGLIEEREQLPGTSKGLFLKDLFSKIIPGDREMFVPTQRKLSMDRITRNIGLAAWIAIVIAACGLLSFSFSKNAGVLRAVPDTFRKPVVLTEDVLHNVELMEQFRQSILNMEEGNRNWWIPKMGLHESEVAERKLKAEYCRLINSGFIELFDKNIQQKMLRFSEATPDVEIGQHVAFLTRRINLMLNRYKGNGLEELQQMPEPSYEVIMLDESRRMLPEIRKEFHQLYLYSLVWQTDTASLNNETIELQKWLKNIVREKRKDLNWLVKWYNSDSGEPPLTLEDFWGDVEEEAEDPVVAPAFTVKGRGDIEQFLKEVDAALGSDMPIATQKADFMIWYKGGYLAAWQNFGDFFPRGRSRLENKERWFQLASTMDTMKNPYFTLIDRMAVELEPFAEDEDQATWVVQVFQFQEIAEMAEDAASGKKKRRKSAIERKILTKVKRAIGSVPTLDDREKHAKVIEAYQNYQTAIAAITPAVGTRKEIFKLTREAFVGESIDSDSPFFKAKKSTDILKKNLSDPTIDDKMFWNLVNGPMFFLWKAFRLECGCHVQKIWEEKVLWQIDGIMDPNKAITDQQKILKLLFDKDGYVNAYVDSSDLAGPFLKRSLRKNYEPKEVLDGELPFTKDFFGFLRKGKQIRIVLQGMDVKEEPEEPAEEPEPVQTDFVVTIQGRPTDVNKGARIRPSATIFDLQCDGGGTRMINRNFPVRKTVEWSSETCGDVKFQIEVGNMYLTRKYRGQKGFAKFLKSFGSGRRTFSATEFPTHTAQLTRLGISKIEVNYIFGGQVREAIKTLAPKKKKKKKRSPIKDVPRITKMPANIASCWK